MVAVWAEAWLTVKCHTLCKCLGRTTRKRHRVDVTQEIEHNRSTIWTDVQGYPRAFRK